MQLKPPYTKAAEVTLAAFVLLVLVIDGYAIRQFTENDQLTAASLSSRISAATTTEPVRGKGFADFMRVLFKQKSVNTTPPATSPPATDEDDIVPPSTEEDLSEEDTLQQEDEQLPVDEWPPIEYEEYEDEWPIEEEELPLDDEWQDETLDAPAEDIMTTLETDEWVETPEASSDTASEAPPAQRAPAATPRPAAARRTTVNTLADLYVTDVSPVTGGSLVLVAAGQPLPLTIRIGNTGSRAASAFSTRIRVDEHADGSWDAENTIAPQDVLPGQSTLRVTSLRAVKNTVPGNNIAEICVDSTNTVTELNETNNCRTIEFTVAPLRPAVDTTPSVLSGIGQVISNIFGSFFQ